MTTSRSMVDIVRELDASRAKILNLLEEAGTQVLSGFLAAGKLGSEYEVQDVEVCTFNNAWVNLSFGTFQSSPDDWVAYRIPAALVANYDSIEEKSAKIVGYFDDAGAARIARERERAIERAKAEEQAAALQLTSARARLAALGVGV